MYVYRVYLQGQKSNAMDIGWFSLFTFNFIHFFGIPMYLKCIK